MIRFIDIENGNVYDGGKPYVFWMDHEQSVNMIYTKSIFVLSDQAELDVSMPDNPVFKLIDISRIDQIPDITINDFKYKNIQQFYTNNVHSSGVSYAGYYVHRVIICGQADSAGEVHEDFTIGDETFEIAADFYNEAENLKINLTNFGVELPESIQNTFYDANVHEESKDNILLNRKYKELLLNYWNIVAGRGSYKSLLDALSWFEYGDLIRIDEIWKHNEWSQTRLNREELNSIMTADLQSSLSNFVKTTYIGLYAALQKFVTENGQVQYDKLIEDIEPDYSGFIGEMTPKLHNKLFKWSVQDMSMKMYLLGAFYEAYFMPIHLDLMHSTIEELVFTNTVKCLNANYLDRVDHVYNTEAFECSVKDGDVFKLQDVEAQGGSLLKNHYSGETPMVNTYKTENNGIIPEPIEYSDDYDDYPIFGIEDEYNQPMQLTGESSDDEIVNDRLKTFMINNYGGIGVVVPFHCEIPAESGDFINYEKITVAVYKNTDSSSIKVLYSSKILEKHHLYNEIDGKFYVDFGLLLTEEGMNAVTLYFTTAGGRSYIKTLHVDVIGDVGCRIKLYKVKSGDIGSSEIKKKYSRDFNDYIFTHVRSAGDLEHGYYHTFITCDEPSSDGVRLNHVFIFSASFFSDSSVSQDRKDNVTNILNSGLFDIGYKYVIDENGDPVEDQDHNYIIRYYILVSKKFVDEDPSFETNTIGPLRKDLQGFILRYSQGYFFDNHHLEELGLNYKSEDDYEFGETLDDYTITDEDTLCVVPELKYSGLKLTDTEWIFKNVSTKDQEEYSYPSIKEPFVGDTHKRMLSPGYYNVIFRYKIGDTQCETRLNSAFRKV